MRRKKQRVMGKALPIVLALLGMPFITSCGKDVTAPLISLQARVDVIYDDDCDEDIDCVTTQPLIHHWIDRGYVKMWGMNSSAPSKFGAPALKVFQQYYGHEGLFTIGASAPACGLRNSAAWAAAVVDQFDAGDDCTHYTSCGTVLRQSVANYIAGGGTANGLVYVITGPLTCEEELRATSADSISPLTGAQMEQKYIKEFVLMNGFAPSGTETNCSEDAVACSRFFANVTSQNGFPPVYVVPLNTGAASVVTQIPNSSEPPTSPSACAAKSIGGSGKTKDEDALAFEFGMLGSTGWKISANSTNTVDASTGTNRWSGNKASGQYYLTTAYGASYFEGVLAQQ